MAWPRLLRKLFARAAPPTQALESDPPRAETTVVRNAALEAEVVAAPYDRDALSVYADALSVGGDVRGEYVALELALARASDHAVAHALRSRIARLAAAFPAHLYGPLAGGSATVDLVLGWPRTLVLTGDLDVSALRAHLAHPAALLLDRIVAPRAQHPAIAALTAIELAPIDEALVGTLQLGPRISAAFASERWGNEEYRFTARTTLALARGDAHIWSFGATYSLAGASLEEAPVRTGAYLLPGADGLATVTIEVAVAVGGERAVFRGSIALAHLATARHAIGLARVRRRDDAELIGVPFEAATRLVPPAAPTRRPARRHARPAQLPALEDDRVKVQATYDPGHDRTIYACQICDDYENERTIVAWRDGTGPTHEIELASAGCAVELLPGGGGRFVVRPSWLVDPVAGTVSALPYE